MRLPRKFCRFSVALFLLFIFYLIIVLGHSTIILYGSYRMFKFYRCFNKNPDLFFTYYIKIWMRCISEKCTPKLIWNFVNSVGKWTVNSLENSTCFAECDLWCNRYHKLRTWSSRVAGAVLILMAIVPHYRLIPPKLRSIKTSQSSNQEPRVS